MQQEQKKASSNSSQQHHHQHLHHSIHSPSLGISVGHTDYYNLPSYSMSYSSDSGAGGSGIAGGFSVSALISAARPPMRHQQQHQLHQYHQHLHAAETPRLRRPTPLRLQPPEPPQLLQHQQQQMCLQQPSLLHHHWSYTAAAAALQQQQQLQHQKQLSMVASAIGDSENMPPQPHLPLPMMPASRQRFNKRQSGAGSAAAAAAAAAGKRPRMSEPPLHSTHELRLRPPGIETRRLLGVAAGAACDEAPLDLSIRNSSSSSSSGGVRVQQQAAASTSVVTNSAAPLQLQQQQQQQSSELLNPMLLSAIMMRQARGASTGPLQQQASPRASSTASASDAADFPDADDPNGAGSCKGGRQPVTSCHQCRQSFLCLRDLNGHFEKDHLQTLLLEFDNTKSWKSSAVDNKELNVEATMVRLENGDTIGFKCPECDYFAKWPTELQKHIMVHSNARPHVCVVCGCTYKWKWDLGRHFDKSHESQEMPNPYKKNTVKPAAASQQLLDSVRRQSCGENFPTPAATLAPSGFDDSGLLATSGTCGSQRNQLFHPGYQLATSATSQIQQFAIESQSPSFIDSPDRLQAPASSQHASLESHLMTTRDSQTAADAESSRQLTCPICGAKARWKSELKSHLINHSNFKPFRCKFCSYRSKWKWDVVKHLKRCTGKKTALAGELDNKEIQAFVIYDPPDPELYSNEAEAILYADTVAPRESADKRQSSSSSGGSNSSSGSYSTVPSGAVRHQSTPAALPPPSPQLIRKTQSSGSSCHDNEGDAAAVSSPASPHLVIQSSTPATTVMTAGSGIEKMQLLRLLPCTVCRHVSRSSADLADHIRNEHCN